MGRKSKYTIEENILVVLDYKNGKRGLEYRCFLCTSLSIGKEVLGIR